MKLKWHDFAIILFFIGLLMLGVSVYHIVEGWSYLDSIYFLVITATTVGYGDLVPVTNVGKIVTIIYSFIGISFVLYMVSLVSHYVFEKKSKKQELNKFINK